MATGYDYDAWRKADNARMNQGTVAMAQNSQKQGALMNTDTSQDLPAQPIINKAKAAIGGAMLRTDGDGSIPTPQSDYMPPDVDLASGQGFKGIIPTGTDPNSQQAAANAQQQQQKTMDQTKQDVADQAVKGGKVPTAVDTANPAASLADRNQNIQAGVGNPMTGANTPPVPTPLTDSQQKNATLNQAGQEEFKSMNTVGDWFGSKSFLMGTMQMGLALLDGKGYAESFAMGSQYFDQHYGQEQRQSWTNDLLKKGYDRQEIQQYIETGDSKVLTSPQERMNKQLREQQQAQSAQIQLEQAGINLQADRITKSPEALRQQMQAEQEDRSFNRQYRAAQLANMNQDNSLAADRLALEKEELQMKRDKLEGKGIGDATNMYDDTHAVVLNSVGTPVQNARTGEVMTRNIQTGRTEWKPASTTSYDAAAQTATMLQGQISDFRNNGLGITGPGWASMKRSMGDAAWQATTQDLQSRIDQINGATTAMIEERLTVANRGQRPTEAQINAAINQVGKLDINNSQARNEEVLKAIDRFANSVNTSADAVRSRGDQSAEMTDRRVIESLPTPGSVIDGYQYLGGDPTQTRNWTKVK